MSTPRARALDYAKTVQEKNAKSRKTPDNFTKPGDTSVPAYQTSNRSNIDSAPPEATALRDEEKKLDKDESRDVTDKTDYAPGNKTGRTVIPDATTTTSKVATNELQGVFAKAWTSVDRHHILQVFHDEKSMYVPSAISMMEILSNVENALDSNEELRWQAPRYFSLPARVYYAVIFYVQIYRAKLQAGTLTKSESSWLRAFERQFKNTSCPIVGPLVPIFCNITSVLPDDNQFDFVYPSAKQGGTHKVEIDSTTKKHNVTVDATYYINPSVIMIADFLKQFCTLPRIEESNFDEHGSFVPFKLQEGGHLGGIHFPAQQEGHDMPQTLAQLLFNPALMHPLPESKARLREIHPHFKKSRARNIPIPQNGSAFSAYGPADFTLLGEDKDWFSVCIEAATAQAKFFSDSTNLSQIHTLGGHSSTLQAELFFAKQTSTPTTISEWFPDIYRQTKSKFRSTTAELPIDHQYNGIYSLTNAKLQWTDHNGHKVGSRASGTKTGPYWDNRKFNYELDPAVEVMSGLRTMITTHFYHAHGVN